MDDGFAYTADAVARVAKTAMAPWGGAEACLDAYETAIRAATDRAATEPRRPAVGPRLKNDTRARQVSVPKRQPESCVETFIFSTDTPMY